MKNIEKILKNICISFLGLLSQNPTQGVAYTTEMYGVVVKARSPGSSHWKGWFALRAVRESQFRASRPASVGSLPSAASCGFESITQISVFMSAWCSPYVQICVQISFA